MQTAIIGVYPMPPPEDSGISYAEVDADSPLGEDFYAREGLRTARALTEIKDYLNDLIP